MDPTQLCQLLHHQLGRLPSMSELMAAMGAPSVGAGAVAEDGPLTAMLRERDAWDQALVRMIFLGGDGPPMSGSMLQPPAQRPGMAMGGPPHFLPLP